MCRIRYSLIVLGVLLLFTFVTVLIFVQDCDIHCKGDFIKVKDADSDQIKQVDIAHIDITQVDINLLISSQPYYDKLCELDRYGHVLQSIILPIIVFVLIS